MILELYVEVGWVDLIRTLNVFSYKTQLLLLPLCWWFFYLSFQTRTLSWIIDICLSSCQVQCLRNLTKDSNNMFKFEQYLFHSSLLFLLYSQLYWRDYKWLRAQIRSQEVLLVLLSSFSASQSCEFQLQRSQAGCSSSYTVLLFSQKAFVFSSWNHWDDRISFLACSLTYWLPLWLIW